MWITFRYDVNQDESSYTFNIFKNIFNIIKCRIEDRGYFTKE